MYRCHGAVVSASAEGSPTVSWVIGTPLAGAALLLALLTACGGSSSGRTRQPSASAAATTVAGAVTAGSPAPAESNPPGDIPDSVSYVRATLAPGRVSFTHPEGWAQTNLPGGLLFSDKLNSVTVTEMPGPVPTVEQVRQDIVATLATPDRAPVVEKVEAATLPAGPAVRVTWRVNSRPDPVTGKVYRDEVVTYLLGHSGSVVRLDLVGAVGSDNVDPYRTMSESLTLGSG
jgi:hypothetical protein